MKNAVEKKFIGLMKIKRNEKFGRKEVHWAYEDQNEG
jgi:hypothetical protein